MKPDTYLICKAISQSIKKTYPHIDSIRLARFLIESGITKNDAIDFVTKPLPDSSMKACMNMVNSEHADWSHEQKVAVCLNVTGQSNKAYGDFDDSNEYSSDPDQDGDNDAVQSEDPDRDSDEDKQQRAKANDLIVLPDDVEGTNCGNCKFFADGYCQNPKVDQEVNERECCALWDNDGVDRTQTQGQDSNNRTDSN